MQSLPLNAQIWNGVAFSGTQKEVKGREEKGSCSSTKCMEMISKKMTADGRGLNRQVLVVVVEMLCLRL